MNAMPFLRRLPWLPALVILAFSGPLFLCNWLGWTADRVPIHVDTELGAKDLLNSRMAYVSVSRGRYDAQIYTNNAPPLGQELSRDVAHSPAIQQEQHEPHPTTSAEPKWKT